MTAVAAITPHRQGGLVTRRRDDETVQPFLAELGERIRQAREAAGLDVRAEFARKVNVDRGTVERWEGGKGAPDAVNMRAIVEVTKASADWLLRGFVAPSWRPTYERWAKAAAPSLQARIWLESLPLEGYEPSEAFYDLALVAFRHGLGVAETVRMATDNLDADRVIARASK